MVLLHATWAAVAHHLGHDPDPEWGSSSGSFLVQLFSSGWQGVQLFFTLSGLVIGLPFARHQLQGAPAVSIGAFYRRRLRRIEPPYIICLTTALLLSGDIRALVPHYLAGLVYAHQLIYQATNPVLDVAWSLEIEAWFYLLAPLFCLVFAVRRAWVRRLALLLVITAYSYWETYHIRDLPRFAYTLPVMLPYFAGGLLLADLLVSGSLEGERHVAWDGVALACAALSAWSAAWNGWDYYWLTPLAMMGVIVAAFRAPLLNRVVRSPLAVIVGGMCYTIYLWHTPILEAIWRVTMDRVPANLGLEATVLLVGGSSLALVAVVTIPLYLAFERPFMGRRSEVGERPAVQAVG